jgi:hypothetical protein
LKFLADVSPLKAQLFDILLSCCILLYDALIEVQDNIPLFHNLDELSGKLISLYDVFL